METDENLTPLKKAYADVILRITEEAATRVMASERKSIKYQHELKVAKEEGVRLLLRLKNMMDAQIRETEAAPLSQQDRIEELETQLEETEDIVRVLREELEEVQSELVRVRKENSCHANGFCSKQRIREHEMHSCQTGEPGLYRNGCTQRIQACEWNHSKRNMCLLGKPDRDNNVGNKKGNETSKALVSGAKLEKKLLANLVSGSSPSFIRKRKRSARQKYSAAGSGGSQSDELVKPEKLSMDSLTKPVETAPSYVNMSGLDRLCEAYSEPQDQIGDAEGPEQQINGDEHSVVMVGQNGKGATIKMFPEVYSLDSLPSEAAQVFSSQILNGKVVKFTYQRKPKKELSEGTEELEMEQKAGDIQSDDKSLELSNTSKESRQEQRRLAQVARQLLSLSGKKWWD